MAALSVGRKQPRTVGRAGLARSVAGVEPGLDGFPRGSVEGRQTLLAALAAHDQIGRIAPHGLDLEPQQFGDAQARGVGHLDQGDQTQARGVLCGAGGGQQGLDLVAAQGFGQAASLLGRIETARRIIGPPAFAQGEAVELPHRGAAACGGGGRQPAPRQIGEPRLQSLLRRSHQAPVAQPVFRIRQVPAIGGQRMGRGVALDRHHLKEGFDLRCHAVSGRLF